MHKVFGDHTEMELPIPRVIDDYNHHMNGVDRANQLRAWMHCGRPFQRRWWRPIWYWLLDTCACNSYLMWKKEWNPPDTGRRLHRKFQEALIEQLWAVPRQPHITTIAPIQPQESREHIWSHWGKRGYCIWCKEHPADWKPHRPQKRTVLGEISSNATVFRGSRTWGGCWKCQKWLCRKGNCMERFHSSL